MLRLSNLACNEVLVASILSCMFGDFVSVSLEQAEATTSAGSSILITSLAEPPCDILVQKPTATASPPVISIKLNDTSNRKVPKGIIFKTWTAGRFTRPYQLLSVIVASIHSHNFILK